MEKMIKMTKTNGVTNLSCPFFEFNGDVTIVTETLGKNPFGQHA